MKNSNQDNYLFPELIQREESSKFSPKGISPIQSRANEIIKKLNQYGQDEEEEEPIDIESDQIRITTLDKRQQNNNSSSSRGVETIKKESQQEEEKKEEGEVGEDSDSCSSPLQIK